MEEFYDIGFPLLLFSLLLMSFLIAKAARNRIDQNIRTSGVSSHLEYLFGGNSVLSAILSNIGSFFSIAVIFGFLGAVFNGRVGGVWSFILPIAVGFLLLTLLFSDNRLSRRAKPLRVYFSDPVEVDSPSPRISIVQFLGHYYRSGRRGAPGPPESLYFIALFYLFFAFMTLSCELGMLRIVMVHGISLSIDTANLMLFLVFMFCYLYVLLGGFRGVLRTDAFQIFVISLCIAALVYSGYLYKGWSRQPWAHLLSILRDRSFDIDWFRFSSLETVFGLLGITSFILCSYDFWTKITRTPTFGDTRYTQELEHHRARRILSGTMVAILLLTAAVVSIGLLTMYDFSDIDDAIREDGRTTEGRWEFSWKTSTGSFRFPLELTKEVYSSQSYDPVLRGYMAALEERQMGGIPSSVILRYAIGLFVLIIAITTIDTEMISISQIFYLSRYDLGILRWTNFKVFLLLVAPIALVFSMQLDAKNFGDWGAYWLAQPLIVAPLVANALFNINGKLKWDILRWPFYFSMSSSIVLFVWICRDPSIMSGYPALLIFALFFLPSTLTLALHMAFKRLRPTPRSLKTNSQSKGDEQNSD